MMLSERKLVVLCVACSAIGIAVLFIVASVAEPLRLSVQQASELDVKSSGSGTNVKVKAVGFVDSVVIRQDYATVTIGSIEAIEAVSFDTNYIRKLGLKKHQEVEVFGELRHYKGKNSLIITKLRLLNTPVNTSACSSGG